MRKQLKNIVSAVLLGGMLLIMFPIASIAGVDVEGVSETQTPTVTPRFTYIVNAECDFYITGETATVDCWVKGDISRATKAKVIAELQVKNSETNWIPVAIWTDTQNDYEAYVYETKTINPSNTYRVKATYTVWEGSQSETHTIFAY